MCVPFSCTEIGQVNNQKSAAKTAVHFERPFVKRSRGQIAVDGALEADTGEREIFVTTKVRA
jgi:hypothetical protein